MQKLEVNETVRQETEYIAAFVLVLSVIMEAVALVIGRWSLSVLLGNALGALAAVGNFFLMGLTVQSAVKKEKKDASNLMRLSQSLRLLLQLGVVVLGYFISVFSLWAVVVPLFFPRIAAAMRPLFNKKMNHKGGESL